MDIDYNCPLAEHSYDRGLNTYGKQAEEKPLLCGQTSVGYMNLVSLGYIAVERHELRA